MAALPKPDNTTAAAIDRALEAEPPEGFRPHLGASLIGRECEREIWMSFRWVTQKFHQARIKRLFDRGNREEAALVGWLRKAGITVWDKDQNGNQFRCSAIGGHFGGSMDGVGVGFPEAPEKPAVLEFKTSNDRAFAKLQKEGVEKAKPEHAAQMQIYMHLNDLTRAMYIAVNKNDDSLYVERVRHSAAVAKGLLAKAERIITSDRPPARISDDPSWYRCKMCDHKGNCHGEAAPYPSCRTCIHATPELDGHERWSCALHSKDLTHAEQEAGCPTHSYIPDLLAKWADQVDASELGVHYINRKNGREFINGMMFYQSAEIHATQSVVLIGHQETDAYKAMDGRLVG